QSEPRGELAPVRASAHATARSQAADVARRRTPRGRRRGLAFPTGFTRVSPANADQRSLFQVVARVCDRSLPCPIVESGRRESQSYSDRRPAAPRTIVLGGGTAPFAPSRRAQGPQV